MLINAVTYTFAAEHADEAAELFVALRAASRAEPGCAAFDVSRADDDPCVFVLHEVWNDRAALDEHYATEHFRRFGIEGIRAIAISRVAHLCTPLAES